MKTIVTAAALVLGMVGNAWAADPIEGLWKTQPDEGIFYHILVQPCGNAFCGSYQKKFEGGAEVSFDAKGKNAIYDMKPTGGGDYKGSAWRASTDKTYTGAGTISGDSFHVGGCILGGLICSKQTWKRLK